MAGFEQALLVTRGKLHEVIASIVADSATMKAWFALMLPHLRRKSTRTPITPLWGPLWHLIRKQKATWDEQYGANHQLGIQWELREPSSVGELHALAMFVLYREVQDNPGKDINRVTGLKWSKHYQGDEEKFFLLYQFLTFMQSYCAGNGHGAGSSDLHFRRPTDVKELPAWKKSQGGRMHAAVQHFLVGE
jgi:hypothetical protein